MASLTILLLLKAAATISNGCIPSLPEFDNERHHKAIDRGVQVLCTSLVIQCEGYITSWRAMIKDHKENTIHFQIWRPVVASDNHYTLVAEDVATIEGGPGRDVVVVYPQNSIPVQSGDIVGIYQASRHHGARIKALSDSSHEMWQYIMTGPSSVGTTLTINTNDGVDHDKLHLVPLIDITIDAISPSVSTGYNDATHGPHDSSAEPHSSTSGPATSVSIAHVQQQHLYTVSNTVTSSMTVAACESSENSEDGVMFLIMIVLVMTVAILLLVVFVLGTALILVSVKLRHVRESSRLLAENAACGNKSDTFVGKQVVIIEGSLSSSSGGGSNDNGHGTSNVTQPAAHQRSLPARTIDNPSYLHGISSNTLYKTPSIESSRLPVQEYENPQLTQVPSAAITTQSSSDTLYSHPRPVLPCTRAKI